MTSGFDLKPMLAGCDGGVQAERTAGLGHEGKFGQLDPRVGEGGGRWAQRAGGPGWRPCRPAEGLLLWAGGPEYSPVTLRVSVGGLGGPSAPHIFSPGSWEDTDRAGMLPSGPGSVVKLLSRTDLRPGRVGLNELSQGQCLAPQPCSGWGGREEPEQRSRLGASRTGPGRVGAQESPAMGTQTGISDRECAWFPRALVGQISAGIRSGETADILMRTTDNRQGK